MICKNCKNQIPDDSNVCEFCGTRVRDLNGEIIQDQPKVENTNNVGSAAPQETSQYTYTANNVPPQPQNDEFNEEEHVSMWQWLGIMAINLIPCVGPLIYLVMMFVWGFGNNPKHSLKTYARASLIMMLIGIVLYIIIFAIVFAVAGGIGAITNDINNGYYY